ncbi:hypothetical protein ZIOFF_009932 [Zingiber officinale]|uniref:PRA1 family protein n=1 Tax=Zingiber officinale TaxID=94328 RepID=A0A8J5HIH8_ZINOF|nr:hypothetical protein ZIOFF_009932 [Zingiber officinale]
MVVCLPAFVPWPALFTGDPQHLSFCFGQGNPFDRIPLSLDFTALTCPFNAGDTLVRIQRNGSLFAFVALLAGWFFLYFSGDKPLVLFGRTIDEGTILGVLSVSTVFALLFSDVGSTVFGAILVALAIVCLHVVFRKTDDLFLDETEATSGGLVMPSFVIPVPQQQQQQSFVRIL